MRCSITDGAERNGTRSRGFHNRDACQDRCRWTSSWPYHKRSRSTGSTSIEVGGAHRVDLVRLPDIRFARS